MKTREQALASLVIQAATQIGKDMIAIFIRSELHDDTAARGRQVQNPEGFKVTVLYKTRGMVEEKEHVTSHVYTSGLNDYTP